MQPAGPGWLSPGPGELEAGPGCRGLPRAFLHSLRTLFDILDDQRRGLVHLREIETRWRGGGDEAEAARVLQCLRDVAPPSGYLTFHTFVIGLRSSLFTSESRRLQGGGTGISTANGARRTGSVVFRSNVKPVGTGGYGGCHPPPRSFTGQPKAPAVKHAGHRGAAERRKSPLRVRSMNTPDLVPERVSEPETDCSSARGLGRHGEDGQEQMEVQMNLHTGAEGKCLSRYQSESNAAGVPYPRRGSRDRAQHRRHTITNGVDYDLLKQMKELEQEKDALLQGLEVVDCAREWYLRQIQAVQQRQKHVEKTTDAREFCSEGNKQRMTQLLSKLQEVKLSLNDLISSAGKPWTASCCDVNRSSVGPGNRQHVTMLKEQNRLLTKEVTAQSERITQLEQEKSALIKQLFEARARGRADSSQLDSTFI